MKTSSVFDASKGSPFKGRRIVLDTNIWMRIEGYGSKPGDTLQALYSDLLRALRDDQNEIVVNNYIIGEFFNGSARAEYEIFLSEREQEGLDRLSFKVARRRPDLRERIETVRDTCLNIIDDCRYEHLPEEGCNIAEIVMEATEGKLDLTDLFIRQFCSSNQYAIVTHDADFAGCGLDLITANRKLLAGV